MNSTIPITLRVNATLGNRRPTFTAEKSACGRPDLNEIGPDGSRATRGRNAYAVDMDSPYESHAAEYDRERSRALVERGWLERFSADLPDGSPVLDLGCGGGEPISAWLIDEGYRVTGVDNAPSLLAIARERWPDGDWRHADMRELDLAERFDGIVAWDSVFHLTPNEQTAGLPRIAEHLNPGGVLLMTVGPSAGATTGTVAGQPVYHASLAPFEYQSILQDNGLVLRAFVVDDPFCAGHTVLFARKHDEDSTTD